MLDQSFVNFLLEQGFSPLDHDADFGYVIPYVFYAKRMKDGLHQYISLSFYEGKFTEGCWEAFLVKKNTRFRGKNGDEREVFEKAGALPIHTSLPRSFDQLKTLVEMSYIPILEKRAEELKNKKNKKK